MKIKRGGVLQNGSLSILQLHVDYDMFLVRNTYNSTSLKRIYRGFVCVRARARNNSTKGVMGTVKEQSTNQFMVEI